jgi:hypothetical protein
MAQDDLRGIVERMVAGGESEADIAAVIQRYKETRTPAAPKAPEAPTVGSVLRNADPLELVANTVIGAGTMAKDIVTGLPQMALKLAKTKYAMETAPNLDELRKVVTPARDAIVEGGKAFGGEVKRKWLTSPGQTAQELYNDPVSMISDLAAVVSGGSTAGLKLASKGGRIANVLGKTGEIAAAADPAALIMKGGAKTADTLGRGAIMATLKTPNVHGEDFGVSRSQMARRVQSSGVTDAEAASRAEEAVGKRYTEKAAELDAEQRPWGSMEPVIDELDTGEARRQAESMRRTADKQDAAKKLDETIRKLREQHLVDPGRPAVPPVNVQGASSAEDVANMARVQAELGPLAATVPSSSLGGIDPATRARIEQLGPQASTVPPRMLANPQGVRIGGSPAVPPTFRPMPPSEMVRDIRTAQDAAFGHASNKKPFPALVDRTKAVNLRQQRDALFPELADLAQESQEAISVRRAFDAAEGAKPNWSERMTRAVGAGVLSGNPLIGAGTLATEMALGSPKLGAKVGIAGRNISNVLANPRIIAIVRAMRAAGRPQNEIDAVVMREMLAQPQEQEP